MIVYHGSDHIIENPVYFLTETCVPFTYAEDANVPLRQIQLFEQCQRDINKTASETLFRISKTLCCRMEDLLEYRIQEDMKTYDQSAVL